MYVEAMLIGSSRALFGVFAVILPTIVLAFALIVTVMVGWRAWFGMQNKPKPPGTKDDPPRK